MEIRRKFFGGGSSVGWGRGSGGWARFNQEQWVKAIISKERRHFGGFLDGIVVGELRKGQ